MPKRGSVRDIKPMLKAKAEIERVQVLFSDKLILTIACSAFCSQVAKIFG